MNIFRILYLSLLALLFSPYSFAEFTFTTNDIVFEISNTGYITSITNNRDDLDTNNYIASDIQSIDASANPVATVGLEDLNNTTISGISYARPKSMESLGNNRYSLKFYAVNGLTNTTLSDTLVFTATVEIKANPTHLSLELLNHETVSGYNIRSFNWGPYALDYIGHVGTGVGVAFNSRFSFAILSLNVNTIDGVERTLWFESPANKGFYRNHTGLHRAFYRIGAGAGATAALAAGNTTFGSLFAMHAQDFRRASYRIPGRARVRHSRMLALTGSDYRMDGTKIALFSVTNTHQDIKKFADLEGWNGQRLMTHKLLTRFSALIQNYGLPYFTRGNAFNKLHPDPTHTTEGCSNHGQADCFKHLANFFVQDTILTGTSHNAVWQQSASIFRRYNIGAAGNWEDGSVFNYMKTRFFDYGNRIGSHQLPAFIGCGSAADELFLQNTTSDNNNPEAPYNHSNRYSDSKGIYNIVERTNNTFAIYRPDLNDDEASAIIDKAYIQWGHEIAKVLKVRWDDATKRLWLRFGNRAQCGTIRESGSPSVNDIVSFLPFISSYDSLYSGALFARFIGQRTGYAYNKVGQQISTFDGVEAVSRSISSYLGNNLIIDSFYNAYGQNGSYSNEHSRLTQWLWFSADRLFWGEKEGTFFETRYVYRQANQSWYYKNLLQGGYGHNGMLDTNETAMTLQAMLSKSVVNNGAFYPTDSNLSYPSTSSFTERGFVLREWTRLSNAHGRWGRVLPDILNAYAGGSTQAYLEMDAQHEHRGLRWRVQLRGVDVYHDETCVGRSSATPTSPGGRNPTAFGSISKVDQNTTNFIRNGNTAHNANGLTEDYPSFWVTQTTRNSFRFRNLAQDARITGTSGADVTGHYGTGYMQTTDMSSSGPCGNAPSDGQFVFMSDWIIPAPSIDNPPYIEYKFDEPVWLDRILFMDGVDVRHNVTGYNIKLYDSEGSELSSYNQVNPPTKSFPQITFIGGSGYEVSRVRITITAGLPPSSDNRYINVNGLAIAEISLIGNYWSSLSGDASRSINLASTWTSISLLGSGNTQRVNLSDQVISEIDKWFNGDWTDAAELFIAGNTRIANIIIPLTSNSCCIFSEGMGIVLAGASDDTFANLNLSMYLATNENRDNFDDNIMYRSQGLPQSYSYSLDNGIAIYGVPGSRNHRKFIASYWHPLRTTAVRLNPAAGMDMMRVAEIEVYGGINVALGRSSFATDGIYESDSSSGAWSSAESGDSHTYTIDLGVEHEIDAMRIWFAPPKLREINYSYPNDRYVQPSFKNINITLGTRKDNKRGRRRSKTNFNKVVYGNTIVFNTRIATNIDHPMGEVFKGIYTKTPGTSDSEYVEKQSGKVIRFPKQTARYVNIRVEKSNIPSMSLHLHEVMVYKALP